MSPRNILLVVGCALAAGCALLPVPRFPRAVEERRTLVVEGRRRVYWLHQPVGMDRRGPWPLVVMLHGHGGTARRLQRVSGMNAQADAAGFAVAYPEGTSWLDIPWRSWNAGNCCGYAVARGIDDVRFIAALLDDLQRAHQIDPRRIYVAGFSNGGMMAYRLACELSDRVAAVGVVAGALAIQACRPDHSVSLMAIHGTVDEYVPYQGGWSPRSGYRRFDQPLAQTVAFWITQDHCAPDPQTTRDDAVRLDTYTGCAEGTGVSVATILDGRHAWPAASWSATPQLWAFFSGHAQPE